MKHSVKRWEKYIQSENFSQNQLHRCSAVVTFYRNSESVFFSSFYLTSKHHWFTKCMATRCHEPLCPQASPIPCDWCQDSPGPWSRICERHPAGSAAHAWDRSGPLTARSCEELQSRPCGAATLSRSAAGDQTSNWWTKKKERNLS